MSFNQCVLWYLSGASSWCTPCSARPRSCVRRAMGRGSCARAAGLNEHPRPSHPHACGRWTRGGTPSLAASTLWDNNIGWWNWDEFYGEWLSTIITCRVAQSVKRTVYILNKDNKESFIFMRMSLHWWPSFLTVPVFRSNMRPVFWGSCVLNCSRTFSRSSGCTWS